MSSQFDNAAKSFIELLQTVAALRDPVKGCPWDKEQTSKSLLPYLLEEAQEFISVVENNEDSQIKEELGDVFFQVILHAQLAFENKLFSINDLCQLLNQKLIQRHPHVFDENFKPIENAEEVALQWNKNKIKKGGLGKLHDAVKLPSLLAAQKIGTFTHGVGFDWQNAKQVMEKVEEELAEVKEAQESSDKDHVAEEVGDLLFSVVQLARHLNLSADYCLNRANQKFYSRFLKLNEMVIENKQDLLKMSLEEKEKLWKKVKSEKDGKK